MHTMLLYPHKCWVCTRQCKSCFFLWQRLSLIGHPVFYRPDITCRPDRTSVVDWALKIKYLSLMSIFHNTQQHMIIIIITPVYFLYCIATYVNITESWFWISWHGKMPVSVIMISLQPYVVKKTLRLEFSCRLWFSQYLSNFAWW